MEKKPGPFTGQGIDDNSKQYNGSWLKYTRNSYDIEFANCKGVAPKSLKFEQSMAGIPDVLETPQAPGNVEPDYTFAGWYTSPACEEGTEVNWNSTMPAHNLIVYAKWQAPTYTVSFNTNGGSAAPDSITVTKHETIEAQLSEIAPPIKEGYAFEGWYQDAACTIPMVNNRQITENLTLYAKWKGAETYIYTVQYVDADGNSIEGVEDKVVSNQVPGTNVTETPIEIAGYYCPEQAQSVHLDSDNKVVTFYYLKVDTWSYTAHYYLEGTTTPVVTDKIVSNATEEQIVEFYQPIEGYELVGSPSESLSKNAETKEITFYYCSIATTYTVNHVYHGVNGDTTDTVVNNEATIGTEVTAVEKPKNGFALVTAKADRKGIVKRGGSLVITLDYYPIEQPYTVRYLEKDTNNVLQPDKTETAKYGAVIAAENEKSDITGYKYDSAAPTLLTISENPGSNVMTLYYVVDDKQIQATKYTVKHVIVKEDGTKEEKSSKNYTGTAWINEEHPTITVEKDSLKQNSYTGYKYSSTDPADVKEGDAVDSKTVITLYYVKDDSQTQDTSYTVKHVVDGVEKTADTKTYKGKAWINEEHPTITVAKDSLKQNGYTGYKYSSINPADVKEGDSVANETVITLYYVKDDSQTQDTSYTVKHVVDGVEKTADTKTYKGKAWINEEHPTITVAKDSLKQNSYTGYKYSSTDPADVKEGDAVDSKTVITLYYVKDTDATQPTSYTVKHVVDGVEKTADTKTYKGKAWINEEHPTITVAKDSLKQNSYTGYKYSSTDPADVKEGDSVANETVITLTYIPNDNTTYSVEYYYQQPDGAYKQEGTPVVRTGATDTLAVLLDSDKQVNITTTSSYVWNAKETKDNQPINGDNSTVLKVYFDLGYRVAYFYRDSEKSEYKLLESSDYIYQKSNRLLKPNVLYDGQWTTSGGMLIWDFDTLTVGDQEGLFKDAFHTLYLYATGKVIPKADGNINVTKEVAGNNTAQDYEFMLELTPEQVKGDRELTTEEANALQEWNGEVSRKELALNEAMKVWKPDGENTLADQFINSGVAVTTDSALKFARVDEYGNVYGLFDGDVTSPSALLYEFDATSVETADETLMSDIAAFIQALSGDAVNNVANLFDAVKSAFAERIEDGVAVLFDAEKAQKMFAAWNAVQSAQAEYDQAVADRMAFTASTKITKPAEVTLVAKYQDDTTKNFVLNADSTYYDKESGKYIFPFVINASATQNGWISFDVQVASGSAIQFVLKETGNGGADSTTVNNVAYTIDGVSGEVTSGSNLKFAFKNTFDTTSDDPIPPVDPEPWTPDPDVPIDDPDVPLAEPDVTDVTEPTEPDIEIDDPDVPLSDVPGEPVEIEDPQVPLNDAPQTGDANNAIPFVVLMMVAGLGLVITRKRFN